MAHVYQHSIVSIIVGVMITYYTNYWFGLLFISGGILIDGDHVLWYMLKEKKYTINIIKTIKEAYTFHINTDMRNFNVINIFHTAEFWIICLVGSYFNVYVLFFSLGLLVHLLMDFGYAFLHNAHHEASRCHSFIRKYYLLKQQGKKISMYNLLV